MVNQKKIPNRLINESSPYLFQHAHNPVDWYPWGDEAFEKAKAEDKPVFLSIGYSTCHWCHVMAHESFEDEQISDILNDGFVSVKADREERPDIDEVYMSVCQAMTGSGGWPLTLLLTPDKKPFFAGTYFPKHSAFGRPGLDELLANIIKAWQTSRAQLLENSEKIMAFFSSERKGSNSDVDEKQLIDRGYAHIKNAFEPRYGGFSERPKFPTPHYLLFLLQYWKARGEKQALNMTEKTLDSMARGGLFDHVGCGFSRYSTDEKWLVPHFEKMLYDNAMLLRAYTECYAATGNEEYREVAEQIAVYVQRDMTAAGSGFYSAEDADSEGEEGRFYVWKYDELQSALTVGELKTLETEYGVTRHGNFEGKNILNRISVQGRCTLRETKVLQKLFNIRKKRVPPFKDTKISAAWNGLMIEALARAGAVFDKDAYVVSAKKAADYVLENMIGETGMLQSTVKDGKHSGNGFLADYANMMTALIELFLATRDALYLKKAISHAQEMVQQFWDKDDERFYMTGSDGESLFMRPKDEYDGAMPSGNASAMMGLVRLAQLTGDAQTAKMADRAVQSFAATANESPGAHVHYLSALMLRMQPHRQIVIAAKPDDAGASRVCRRIQQAYLPFTTVICDDENEETAEVLPQLIQYRTDAPFAAYVCENFACKSPIYDPDELMRQIGLA